MEKYEFVKELNAGSNYSVTKLMRNKQTEEVVAMKFIELGPQVLVSKTHAALVMEYVGEEEISKDKMVDGMEKYEIVDDYLGSGSFGVTKLVRNKNTKELFAVKFIERGPTIDENVEREIINHRSLQHPNIVRFKEASLFFSQVILTSTKLGIVMEYAGGGQLFRRISNSGCCTEDEARYFFQQLICGLEYIHSMQICHRDLKLDNILLDGSKAPRVKICDFGYSKSSMLYSKPNTIVDYSTTYAAPMDQANGQDDGQISINLDIISVFCHHLEAIPIKEKFSSPRAPWHAIQQRPRLLYPLHSIPNTRVGSTTYSAPEVLVEGQYNGKIADVWSCGVTLYVMLFGSYPFEDPNDPKNIRKTIKRIMHIDYKIPENIKISEDCRDLLSHIFVVDPSMRIPLQEIKSHPWFEKKLAWELRKEIQALFYMRNIPTFSHQSVEEIMKVVGEAKKKLPSSSTTIVDYNSETEKEEETNTEENEEDEEAMSE
ncbi:hypothetical protein Csa_012923 [Cucumis sativus]|nr:hypothetical protein Csa_012923 [Cucumis sativus]